MEVLCRATSAQSGTHESSTHLEPDLGKNQKLCQVMSRDAMTNSQCDELETCGLCAQSVPGVEYAA